MRVLTLMAVVLGLALAQTNHSSMNPGGSSMKGMAALESLSGRAFDVAFMSQMIAHHQGAVVMAQRALEVSQDPRIRGAAQAIVDVQQKEIAQLRGWLKSWYNLAPDKTQIALMQADIKPMMDKSMAGMTPMQGMNMNVDRAFLEGMIPHHQDAVAMSELALKKAAKPQLRQFAQGVIATQQKEIAQYQEWLKTL